MNQDRIGIIDIGSNSIRLVIYERTASGGYHVIDESKGSARLSERIGNDGRIAKSDIEAIIVILHHFKLLCTANETNRIRAVATAAIRNAINSAEVLQSLQRSTGLPIEILTGEQEAYYGFLGMINTIDLTDGFIIDIGGGSTEISLFRNRSIIHSVSLPYGAVNTTKRIISNPTSAIADAHMLQIKDLVEQAIKNEPWIRQHIGLPLIGLGGTIRNLCKIHQKHRKYSLQLNHNYQMNKFDVEQLLLLLQKLPLEKRKKVEGLTSDRADIIVPGIGILHTIFEACRASHYVISGSGLRDGLFFHSINPDHPQINNVLEHSIRNLMALHPSIPYEHVEHVNRLAMLLFDGVADKLNHQPSPRIYLYTASLLHRIGVTINYYDYAKHTYYLIAHSRIDGLTHREIIVCALIASFKTKSRTRQQFNLHKDLLEESDYLLIIKLGSLLRLAIALDRSETQPITKLTVQAKEKQMIIKCLFKHNCEIELKEVREHASEFYKIWNMIINISIS